MTMKYEKLQNGVLHEEHLGVKYTLTIAGADDRFDPVAEIEGQEGKVIYGDLSETYESAVADIRAKAHSRIEKIVDVSSGD